MVEEDRGAQDSGYRRLKTNWGAIWAVFGAGLICGAYMTKVAPALPLQRAELGLTLVETGFIATVFNVMGGLVGIFLGTLADRLGLRRAALGGLLLLVLAGLLGASAQGFALLLFTRFIEGIGFLMFAVSGSALIASASANASDRSKALGLWAAYMPVGGGIALLLASPAIAAWGWRGLWILLAALAAASFMLAIRHAPSPPRGNVASLRLITETLAQPGCVALGVLFGLYVSQWASVMIWLPTFLVDERGASATEASLLTAVMVLANAPGNVAGGWLLTRGVRRGPMVIATSAFMALCTVGMLAPALPDGLRYLLCLLFSGVAGIIPGAVFSGLPVHARTPQHISTANGLVLQTSQIGQFAGPLALAWLASSYGGWGATLWAMLFFALGSAACGIALHRLEPARA